MKASFLRRADTVSRHLVPCALTFAMLFVGLVPLHLPSFQAVAPSLPLIAVFYWTLYRPDLMPVLAVFLIGLLQDILGGLPIGVSSVTFVCVHAAVTSQRRFFIGKSFSIIWLGFTVVAVGALALSWLLSCAYYGASVSLHAVAFQVLITVGCFPVVCWLLLRCQLSLLRQI
ncbi:MAG: rod shape-determining protein MreD [Rhodospirillales bacterium]|nr:rod shape-determining protein MreD [Rhodospirillales bacterium]